MGILDDVLKALDRIPGWKRVQGLPAELDALAARVKALEDALAGPNHEYCGKCGERSMRRISMRAVGPSGQKQNKETWECKCGHREHRISSL
jgi:hypothetical protein